jgi:TonB family protein
LEGIKARLSQVRTLEFPTSRLSEPDAEKSRVVPLVMGIVVVLAVLIGILVMRGHTTGPAPAAETQSQASPAVAPAAPAAAPTAPVAAPAARAPAPTRTGTAKGTVAQRAMPDVASYATATIRGTVLVAVQVAVDASGQVTNATFKSAGPSRYFADRALIAARGWRFKPAEKNGQAVGSEWLLRFRFRRSGNEAEAIEVIP